MSSFFNNFSSKGFTKRISTKVALSSFEILFASSKRVPKFKITISELSSFIIFASPILKGLRSLSTLLLGPVPLGYLTEAGPLCKYAVVNNFLVSFSSEGVHITMFGIHLK